MEKKTAVLTVLGVLSLAASFAATGPAARPPATLAGQSELFKPLQKMGRGIVSTAAHVVASGDLVLVSFQNPDPRAKKTADIFQAGKQVGSVDIPGTPYNVDAQGRIYFAETDPFPRVVRYVLEKQ